MERRNGRGSGKGNKHINMERKWKRNARETGSKGKEGDREEMEWEEEGVKGKRDTERKWNGKKRE